MGILDIPSYSKSQADTKVAAVNKLVRRGVRRQSASNRVITIASSAPTVTFGVANAATSITGSTVRAPKGAGVSDNATIDMVTDPNFAYTGTPGLISGTASASSIGYAKASFVTGTLANDLYTPSAHFNFYGDKFEILLRLFTTSTAFRFRVDGQWVTHEATFVSGTIAGSNYRILVDFGSVGTRKIQFDWLGVHFGGVAALPAHTVRRASVALDMVTLLIADSISTTANPGSVAGYTRADSWVTYTSDILGWRNLYNTGEPGTGFTLGSTSGPAFTAKLADIALATGGRVVVAGGLNDSPYYSALPAAIDTVFSAIVAAAPEEFIVLGCHVKNNSAYTDTNYIKVNDLLRSKAQQYGAIFIDTFALAWINGTGYSGATNGSGNSDLFLSTDNLHPTRAGAQFLGRMYADAIAAAMPTLGA